MNLLHLIGIALTTIMSLLEGYQRSVTSDPSVRPLRELAYLPEGIMDPHELPANQTRSGKLPSQIIKNYKQRNHKKKIIIIRRIWFQIN